MAGKNIKAWITINHRHIPIMEGETKEQAVKRFKAVIDKKKAEKASGKKSATAPEIKGHSFKKHNIESSAGNKEISVQSLKQNKGLGEHNGYKIEIGRNEDGSFGKRTAVTDAKGNTKFYNSPEKAIEAVSKYKGSGNKESLASNKESSAIPSKELGQSLYSGSKTGVRQELNKMEEGTKVHFRVNGNPRTYTRSGKGFVDEHGFSKTSTDVADLLSRSWKNGSDSTLAGFYENNFKMTPPAKKEYSDKNYSIEKMDNGHYRVDYSPRENGLKSHSHYANTKEEAEAFIKSQKESNEKSRNVKISALPPQDATKKPAVTEESIKKELSRTAARLESKGYNTPESIEKHIRELSSIRKNDLAKKMGIGGRGEEKIKAMVQKIHEEQQGGKKQYVNSGYKAGPGKTDMLKQEVDSRITDIMGKDYIDDTGKLKAHANPKTVEEYRKEADAIKAKMEQIQNVGSIKTPDKWGGYTITSPGGKGEVLRLYNNRLTDMNNAIKQAESAKTWQDKDAETKAKQIANAEKQKAAAQEAQEPTYKNPVKAQEDMRERHEQRMIQAQEKAFEQKNQSWEPKVGDRIGDVGHNQAENKLFNAPAGTVIEMNSRMGDYIGEYTKQEDGSWKGSQKYKSGYRTPPTVNTAKGFAMHVVGKDVKVMNAPEKKETAPANKTDDLDAKVNAHLAKYPGLKRSIENYNNDALKSNLAVYQKAIDDTGDEVYKLKHRALEREVERRRELYKDAVAKKGTSYQDIEKMLNEAESFETVDNDGKKTVWTRKQERRTDYLDRTEGGPGASTYNADEWNADNGVGRMPHRDAARFIYGGVTPGAHGFANGTGYWKSATFKRKGANDFERLFGKKKK